MTVKYRASELHNLLATLQSSDANLGKSIRRELSAAGWNDETGEKLTDNICAEAETILHKQTEHIVRYPGLFEMEYTLADAFSAYEETVALLGGGS